LVDAGKGLIKIKNWHSVASLSRIRCYLQVREDGNIIAKKQFRILILAAGNDTIISIKQYLPRFKTNHEYLADIHFTLARR
jgi:beta-galactosidase